MFSLVYIVSLPSGHSQSFSCSSHSKSFGSERPKEFPNGWELSCLVFCQLRSEGEVIMILLDLLALYFCVTSRASACLPGWCPCARGGVASRTEPQSWQVWPASLAALFSMEQEDHRPGNLGMKKNIEKPEGSEGQKD